MRDQADARVGESLASSFIATLPVETVHRITAGAFVLDIPAGSVIYRSDDSPRIGLVVAGLVRIFLTSAEGRQVTVRYARSGAVVGAATTIGGPVDLSAQAITETSILALDVHAIRAVAAADPSLAWALAEEVTRRLYEVLEAFAGNAFGSVRQRVARHLLDLAADNQDGALLIAPVSQQGLADAVGTAREVVARTLGDFRQAGLVDTSRGILLTDPGRLSVVAATGEV